MRIGIGYDIHRLVKGRSLKLGGVKIPYAKGPKAHSDGDVLLHAICDAILGAMREDDIGTRFPDTDPKYKDIDSIELLQDVADFMNKKGFALENLDTVIVTEEPKIRPYRNEMIRTISRILKVKDNAVNIKGKTSGKVGEIGRGEAIAAHAVVLLVKKNK